MPNFTKNAQIEYSDETHMWQKVCDQTNIAPKKTNVD